MSNGFIITTNSFTLLMHLQQYGPSLPLPMQSINLSSSYGCRSRLPLRPRLSRCYAAGDGTSASEGPKRNATICLKIRLAPSLQRVLWRNHCSDNRREKCTNLGHTRWIL